ncbi:hypothetical protein T261_8593 [Streptomyces lydicus]|nr:hypothetical protein T261_8593 [Streptomyces lydicus]
MEAHAAQYNRYRRRRSRPQLCQLFADPRIERGVEGGYL